MTIPFIPTLALLLQTSLTVGFPISKSCFLRNSRLSEKHLQQKHHYNTLNSVSTPKEGDMLSSSSKDEELMRQTIDNSNEEKADEGLMTQLWLDIRGLDISPTEAIRDLSVILNKDSEDDENNCSPVAKVLISKEESEKYSKSIHHHNDCNDENSPEILVVDTSSRPMVLGHPVHSSSKHDGTDSKVEKRGILFLLRDQINCDPIAVIEALSKHEWVVIDSTEMKQEMEKQEAVGNLLGFVAAAGVNPIPVGIDWDLVVPQNQLDENYDPTSSSSMGGIAICCQTKGDLVNAQTCIHSLNVGRSIDTSEGGILLLSSSDKEVDDENASSQNIPQSQSAVVLPLDLMMWKAALSIFDFHE